MATCKRCLQFGYVNLPKNWAYETWEDTEIPDYRRDKISKSLSRIPKGTKLFVQNNCGVIVNELLNNFEFSQISGIDFVEYFKGAMGKSEEVGVVPKEIVVIYNVGIEPAINLTYSSKLLIGLIKKLEQENCIILLQSDSPRSKINRDYGIDFVNNIKIPYREEENIF